MSVEAEASDGPMSIDQAAAMLDAADEPAEQPQDEATLSEAEPTAEDDPQPDEVTEDETEEQDAGEPSVVAAPQSWDAEHRALWPTLPPEAQQYIAERDADALATVSRANDARTEAVRRADETIRGVTDLKAATEAVLTKAQTTFKGKWDNIDWPAWAQSDPAAYTAGRAMYEAEQHELSRLDAVTQQQTALAMQQFQKTKIERLEVLAPELLKDPALVRELEDAIVAMGVDRNILHTLDAETIALARDGFRWRAAQKARPTSPDKPKPAPAQQQRAAIRPGAAPSVRSPQRAHDEARQRLQRSGSIEDAVRLLDLRK